MNNKYTMEDIEEFIWEYSRSQGARPSDLMLSVPFIGRQLYEQAALADQKRSIFRRAYIKAIEGTPEEQQEFIEQMTPVLEEYYSKSRRWNK